jgi:hypothetical protein
MLDHVDSFLLHVDTRGTFLKVAELLSETAAQDAEVEKNLSAIRAWTQTQIDILSQQVPRSGLSGDILGSPAEATLLAVSYLRARAGLRAGAASVPSQLKKAVADARKLLDTLEPDFISGLLIETERRASRDPVFANTLNKAVEDLRWLGGQLIYLPGLDVPQTLHQQGVASRELSVKNRLAQQTQNRSRLWEAIIFIALCCIDIAKHSR